MVRTEGTRQVRRPVQHYSLDAILAVGFRVRSHRGTQFRKWANARLSVYLVKGFTMDDERLKNPPGRGNKDFSEDVLRAIKENGTYPWDPDIEEGLRVEGWKYLERHACGDAKPERDLRAASVSYVSALCGFLMGAQYIAEVLGASRWRRRSRRGPVATCFANRQHALCAKRR